MGFLSVKWDGLEKKEMRCMMEGVAVCVYLGILTDMAMMTKRGGLDNTSHPNATLISRPKEINASNVAKLLRSSSTVAR